MKRVCIITCNNAENYGARLQAYALATAISRMGHRARVIDYAPWYMRFATRLWYFPGVNPKEWAKLLIQKDSRRMQIVKHRRLEEFSRKYIPTTLLKYMSINHLRVTPPTADVYVAGSDQIWNTDFPNGKDPAYYLDFGDDRVRRMSYAASFAISAIGAEHRDFVKSALGRLDAISVREESGARILDEMGYPSTTVCDPAFLLAPDDWDKIASPIEKSEPYLLVYDFMQSRELRQVAERIASLRGLKIYSVSPHKAKYAHRNFSDCSPEDFVALVREADCVLSNSLHGSIFAMIYRKDFYVVNRGDGLNVRMRDLLERYGLSNRLVAADVDDPMLREHIEYQGIAHRLQADINSSALWLKTQIEWE